MSKTINPIHNPYKVAIRIPLPISNPNSIKMNAQEDSPSYSDVSDTDYAKARPYITKSMLAYGFTDTVVDESDIDNVSELTVTSTAIDDVVDKTKIEVTGITTGNYIYYKVLGVSETISGVDKDTKISAISGLVYSEDPEFIVEASNGSSILVVEAKKSGRFYVIEKSKVVTAVANAEEPES